MEITRAEGTGRFLKRFDFIARARYRISQRERRNELAKKRGKKWAIVSVTYDVRSADTFCPLASDFRSFLSRTTLILLSLSPFFILRSSGEIVCTRTGWQIGRGISFYRMREASTPGKVGKVSGRMQYSRRPGRQRMSSAHESGYPNEIQYSNVEDHPTVFTRASPLSLSSSCNENSIDLFGYVRLPVRLPKEKYINLESIRKVWEENMLIIIRKDTHLPYQ